MKKTDEQFERLKYYRFQNDKKGLAKEIRKLTKRLNQRYRELEKKGLYTDSYAYKVSQGETGRKIPRYTESQNVLERMSIEELFELGLQVNTKLYSSSSRVKGVYEIQDKRITKAVESLTASLGKDVDKQTFKDFIEKGGSELLNNKYLDSEQVIDDFLEITKEGNISIKEFIREFKRYKKQMSENKRIDYAKIKRNLNNLVQRNKNKRNKNKRTKSKRKK